MGAEYTRDISRTGVMIRCFNVYVRAYMDDPPWASEVLSGEKGPRWVLKLEGESRLFVVCLCLCEWEYL